VDTDDTFGGRLRTLRTKHRYSTRSLADAAGEEAGHGDLGLGPLSGDGLGDERGGTVRGTFHGGASPWFEAPALVFPHLVGAVVFVGD